MSQYEVVFYLFWGFSIGWSSLAVIEHRKVVVNRNVFEATHLFPAMLVWVGAAFLAWIKSADNLLFFSITGMLFFFFANELSEQMSNVFSIKSGAVKKGIIGVVLGKLRVLFSDAAFSVLFGFLGVVAYKLELSFQDSVFVITAVFMAFLLVLVHIIAVYGCMVLVLKKPIDEPSFLEKFDNAWRISEIAYERK